MTTNASNVTPARSAPVRAHWGVEDPAAAAPDEWECAFQTAYDRLLARANALLALPIEDMDRDTLQAALHHIGTQH